MFTPQELQLKRATMKSALMSVISCKALTTSTISQEMQISVVFIISFMIVSAPILAGI